MRLPRPALKKARIEIIPMIDAIFFLLVYFMYSSLSMVKMNGLPVILPKAPTAEGTGVPKPASSSGGIPQKLHRLVLTIPISEGITLNGEQMATEALVQNLTTRLQTDPQAVVVVRTAKGVTTQRLVEVMDRLNQVSLPTGEHANVVIATVAAPPTDRSNVLGKGRLK